MPAVFQRPGVAVEQFPPAADLVFRTGVVAFIGPAVGTPPASPIPTLFTTWRDFAVAYKATWQAGPRPDDILWNAVQGFFSNGGVRCWVVLYDPSATGNQLAALDRAVQSLANNDDIDLVCAPSLVKPDNRVDLVRQLIRSCEQMRVDPYRKSWFLLLDPPPPDAKIELADWIASLRGAPLGRPQDVALYHPWLAPGGGAQTVPGATLALTPPSGHVAGVYARTDSAIGVHKAPANEILDGVVDVADVADVDQANAIRALPGRGIRIWGARTLFVPPPASFDTNAFVGVRRLVLTLERWLLRALDWVTFEANDLRLWVRVHRELEATLGQLFARGLFQGKTPDEAFYVKCDAENNPPDDVVSGKLQIEIGIAPAVPKEFIKIRVVRDAESLTVA